MTGRKVLRYGGDFDDRPSDYEFSGNGIVFADQYGKTGNAGGETLLWTTQTEDKLGIVYGDATLGVHGEGLSI